MVLHCTGNELPHVYIIKVTLLPEKDHVSSYLESMQHCDDKTLSVIHRASVKITQRRELA